MMKNNATGDKEVNTQVKSQAPSDERLLVKWLEQEPIADQTSLAEKKIQELLRQASQPRHASGKACLQLCHFVEQCKKSQSQSIRDVAFSKITSLGLFNFYVEWNEKNQARSMRQVLELLSSLIGQNPDRGVSSCVKDVIFQQSLPLITHEAAQPLVKPSFKSLECLLGKSTISPEELLTAYEFYRAQIDAPHTNEKKSDTTDQSWDYFVSAVFYWLGPADVSAAAGKFLVTLFKTLRTNSGVESKPSSNYSSLWQRWIRTGLSRNPLALENVKNYLFSPLFKLDRPGSLEFLQDLNKQGPMSNIHTREINAHALVQLAAIDAGKKSGLVEEPNVHRPQNAQSKKSSGFIVLDEETIGSLLTNSSDTIRSLAFSVLTSSFSSTRPFSPAVLEILKPNMGLLYSDTDAKFRNEVLSNTKHLIERLRGATALLARELEQSSFKLSHGDPLSSVPLTDLRAIHDATEDLLFKHQKFLEWYVDFLLGELSPTSSYQRHIMALRAINLLLHSHIRGQGSDLSSIPVPANATIWPFTLQFFNGRSMRLLLDLLLDPFEDVRSSAADVLKLSHPANFSQSSAPDQENSPKYVARVGSSSSPESVQETEVDERVSDRLPSLLMEFISRAEVASRNTGRADYADGVARSYRILYGLQTSLGARLEMIDGLVKRLEEKVVMAESDLALAVSEAPLHGDFAALSLISSIVDLSLDSALTGQSDEWEKWASLQLKMVTLAFRIWNAVKEVLCNDSPEGNLPNGIDELDTIDTKDVLSYSFRAIHESSNLTRIISLNLTHPWPETFAPFNLRIFTTIGNLAFEQLSTLRHRGAFSTVSLTFSSCCTLTQHQVLKAYSASAALAFPDSSSSQPDLSSIDNLLGNWWLGTLEAIKTQPATTRRSAGIPSLVAAIMAATGSHSMSDIDNQIKTLTSIAREDTTSDENSSDKVHALNSLRGLFRDSNTRVQLEHHVVETLCLAEECFGSKRWSIHNCGLLLFQTLIEFILGSETKDQVEHGWNGEGTKIQFSKYPGLLDLLRKMLEKAWPREIDNLEYSTETVEQLFPALDIFRRAGSPVESQEIIYQLVAPQLGNKSWHVRDLAARTICALLPNTEWESSAEKLLGLRNGSTNLEHGVLLAVRHIFEREKNSVISDEQLEGYCQRLNIFFHNNFGERKTSFTSPDVLAANLEVGNVILRLLIQRSGKTGVGSSIHNSATTGFTFDPYMEMRSLCQLNWDPVHADFHAALGRGIAISELTGDHVAFKKIFCFAFEYSQSGSLDFLNKVPTVRHHERIEMFRHYAILFKYEKGWVYPAAISPAVRAAALRNIVDMLDGVDDISSIYDEINEISQVIRNDRQTPELAKQICKFSAHEAHATLRIQTEPRSAERALNSYGFYLEIFLRIDAVDARLAATSALFSFFKRQGYKEFIGSPYLLPMLMTLYNTLNDDDDSVRILGASAVGFFTKKSSTPPAAANEFLNWMVENHKYSLEFAHNTVERVTGRNLLLQTEGPTADFDFAGQIAEMVQPDNSLFAEEDQNLWLDGSRECIRWAKAFRTLYRESTSIYIEDDDFPNGTPLDRLTAYATEGLRVLTNVVLFPFDTAQSWASKPKVYALCARVVICTHEALVHLAYKYSEDDMWRVPNAILHLLVEVKRFMDRALTGFIHPQVLRLLLGVEALEENRLRVLLPQPVASMVCSHRYLEGPQASLLNSPSSRNQA